MEKIFVLGNSDIVKKLGYECREIPNLFKDNEIHSWLLSLFQNNEIEKLIIEIGDNPELSLKIGLHIRLMLEELRMKSLIPMVFISTSTLNVIMKATGIWSHLLVTKGVYFISFENIKDEISAVNGLTADEYKTGFLNIIKILPDETIGRHSLANIWGAYRMDKAANTNALANEIEIKHNQSKLYFKYRTAFNFDMKMLPIKIVGRISVGQNDKSETIDAKGKRILLIDDEADKGWETVLRKVFKTSLPEDFVVIKEKVKDYSNLSAGSKNLIENTPFDLYLIDLRLNGSEEENTFKSSNFSGMKVLKKIKSLNTGYQVIIFTASNKVWNLKALLDEGADGYYMKESPEFGFSSDFSEQNYLRFQEDVKRCFEKDFLRELYIPYQIILQKINGLSTYSNDFKEEIRNQLELFWDMISSAKTETQFAYSYITLYTVIEIVNNYFIQHNLAKNQWEITGAGALFNWEWDKTQNKYTHKNVNVTGNNPPEWQKFAGLYFQKWQETNQQSIQNIYHLIRKRNGFIHKDISILDEKNKQGEYLNRDIYTKAGTVKLFKAVEKIIEFF